jgi:peptide/nickel transport system substrate-binding protein
VRAAAVVALVALSLAAAADGAAGSSDHPCLVAIGVNPQPFNRNFNPFANPLDFTWGGIYEPLVVVTQAGGGHEYLWLASRLEWSTDGKTLTITVRPGVKWTDGRPLTAEDVRFTLTAGRREKGMDQIGLTRPGNEVASVAVVAPDKVAVRLKHRDSSFVARVLANNLFVVPAHVFAKVKHVGGWSNPNPVGTGPFAVVRHVTYQSVVLDRNPHYWRKGEPHFACIKTVLASSGEAALMQMVHGDVDLTDNYVPNVQKAYVSHDPAHFHFFYATVQLPIGLFFDDSQYPYSLVALRKAISMAIDRRTLSQFAEFGYAPPVDALGIDHDWSNWVGPAIAAQSRRLAAYNPDGARRLLEAAGFTYAGKTLLDPRGSPVTLDASVIASWTDWVTGWQVVAKNLAQIGIHVTVDRVADWGAWQPGAFATKTATFLWNNFGNGPTPYDYFEQHLDRASFVPSGKNAEMSGNWEHFWSPEGTRLLRAFRSTSDLTAQHRLAAKLERLWLRTLPYVPLFVGPVWSTYSTRHFTGFPNARDYYIQPSTFSSDYVVALVRIRPVS